VSLSDADAYDRFMGRYSRPLAVPFADFAGLPLDGRVLDVGCGPGALTAELARRAGPERVTAVDPSEEYVAALRDRQPGVRVIPAPAEDLPFEGGCFDATLAQLVVNVMDDPVAGLHEMARVTRDGGGVAACVWDFTDGGPIGPFWDAAQALDPEVETGSVCLWGAQIRFHAAWLYSWISPPSRSRRVTSAGRIKLASSSVGCSGSGGVRLSARCGRWPL
jgi:SAM-dependent methyltransferase